MRICLMALILLVVSLPASLSHAKCPASVSVTLGAKNPVTVRRLSDRLFFSVTKLELDFDGSPVAYGVKDQGQENICVGLAPKDPPCRGKFQGKCYKVCQQTFASWSRRSGDPRTIPETMCSVGLGGAHCSVPDVRIQKQPDQDYFVSETSFRTSPEEGKVDVKWLQDQKAQLDPARLRYIVVPGAIVNKDWGVQFGDVGVAYSAHSSKPISFIVGDGGQLGEASVSMLAALDPLAPPRLKAKTNALGKSVMRYTAGISGDFSFVIFRNTASLVPEQHNVTTLPASKLPDWIDTTAMKALAARSSEAEVRACRGGRR